MAEVSSTFERVWLQTATNVLLRTGIRLPIIIVLCAHSAQPYDKFYARQQHRLEAKVT